MKKLLIYLIDDDSDDREIFNIALTDFDNSAACITAESGIEAIRRLQTDNNFLPDYIFLDLNMPLMSGTETLIEMKKINRINSIPVIIYTTSSYEKDIAEARRLGASHYFLKPSNIDGFQEALTRLFLQTPDRFCINC